MFDIIKVYWVSVFLTIFGIIFLLLGDKQGIILLGLSLVNSSIEKLIGAKDDTV